MQKRTIALVEALADGVAAYLTLQARCGLWPACSEYLLYDRIVRIAFHLGWAVNCEYKLPKTRVRAGDNPRLDFMFVRKQERLAIAMEVKWPRDPKKGVSLVKDLKKLREVKPPKEAQIDRRLLLVAGPHEISENKQPALRRPIRAKGTSLITVRALGVGKRAWGVLRYLMSWSNRSLYQTIASATTLAPARRAPAALAGEA
jgi:hypothetical protein